MMRPSYPTRRLLGFVFASICLHGALLIAQRESLPQFPGQTETILSVALNPSPAPVATTAAAQDAPRQRKTSRALPAATTSETETLPTAGTAPTAASVPQDSAAELERHRQTARAQIRAQLLTDLARHFEYPLLAQRRGWEGTVWLAFVVAPDGVLERIHVAHGSGYHALDYSAVSALHRVGRLQYASRWLGGNALEMRLPVIYRLQEP